MSDSLWVDVDGGRLYVEAAGTGEPLLLVHGWPLDHRMFEPQFGPLSTALHVIAYDRRGFGQTTAPANMREELVDIDAILDALNLHAVHLLGMSQGGRIALRYAATRPRRVRSLLLQGAIVDGLRIAEQEADSIPVAEYASLAKAGKLDEVRKLWLAHPMMRLDPCCTQEQQLLAKIVADYSGQDLIHFEPESYAFDSDVLTRMAGFESPVLLLTGALETEARRRHAAELLATVPDCREVVFRRSGHLCNLTEAERFNQVVIEFCRELPARSTIKTSRS